MQIEILTSIVKQLKMKMDADMKGTFKISKLSGRRGGKSFHLGGLEVIWNFTGLKTGQEGPASSASGKSDIRMTITNLMIADQNSDMEFNIESIELSGKDEIRNFLMVLPVSVIGDITGLTAAVAAE